MIVLRFVDNLRTVNQMQQLIKCTEEPRNSAFQGTCGCYALLREMPYCQYIELKEKASRDLEFIVLLADALLRGTSVVGLFLKGY